MKKSILFFMSLIILILFQFCGKNTVTVKLLVDSTINIKNEGWSLLQNGQIEKAKEYFDKSDDEYEKYSGLGYVYLESNKLKKAKEYFLKALDLKESFILYSGLAQTEERMGDKVKALDYYREALNFYNDSYIQAKVSSFEGELSEKLLLKLDKAKKNSDKREKLIKELLIITPKAEQYRIELIGYLFYKGDYEGVIKYYNGLLNNEKKPDEKTRLYYAKSLYKTGLYKSALTEIEDLYRDYPDDQEYENLYYEWRAKVESLKINDYIKDIRNKEKIVREEVAALLYSGFNKYIDRLKTKSVIILDIDNSWAKNFIMKLVFTGIMKIEDNHTFNPDKPVTKMEMASILYNLLKKTGISLYNKERIYIRDIPIYHIKRKIIEKIIALNIMKLDNKNRFNPLKIITGREILDILEKLKYTLEKNEN
jgi:tetratricopeptide (TPR) repeat protein